MPINRRTLLRAAALTATTGALGVAGSGALASAAPDRLVHRPTEKWMSLLGDNVKLSQLTIPGTHETCALYDGGAFGYAQCQEWRIPQQLQAGVRFLDIRCRVMGDVFTIHHDKIYQKINFGDVLNLCIDFLKSNPRETIIMRIRKEYTEGQDYRFSEIFNYYMDGMDGKGNYRPWFWLPKTGSLPDGLPTLGQVRGKIVPIMSDFTWGDGRYDPLRWGDSNRIWLQDEFGDGSSRKVQRVRAGLDTAFYHQDDGKLYIHFASASAFPEDPYRIAKVVNPSIRDYLTPRISQRAHYGVIAMDFVDERKDLLQMIVDWNFGL
ncbi:MULTISPECIES: phosphatidylinositol-specific phospholipase C [unclassified Kitasatospora]|uniref:phosphatidylinositol-specific phospholipase C n=1 Tax=unclassified Kitasatospora TaxID=2633591 RepID=UPI0033C45990